MGNYSSFCKLVKHIVCILKLKHHWMNKKEKMSETVDFKEMTVKEFCYAEDQIFLEAQRESCPNEINALTNNKTLPKTSNLLSLRPFLLDNLLRLGGRIGQSFLSFHSKHQIILPKNHPLSALLVQDTHVRNCHSGRDLTLSLIREKFCIVHAKSLIRKVLFDCHYFKRQRVLRKPPLISELPLERLSVVDQPFIHTGVDYFGPLLVRLNKKIRANQAVAKRYGATFTCLSLHALHIELAGDMSTDSFILALRRFISRKGYPKSIISDNSTNFVGAQRELSEALRKLDISKIKDDLNQRHIIWKFNPRCALWIWIGGATESMVKITKKALKSIVSDRIFTDEALSTFLTEVESIINSRPLTAASDDINDLEPITPNHFLIGKSSPNYRSCVSQEQDISLRKKLKAV